MLKFLRKNTKVIVWSVVIAFVAWGGYAVSVQFEESSRAAGRIFGKSVSFREYLTAGQVLDLFYLPAQEKEPPTAEELEAKAWQFLVISREAKRQKVVVSDDEVRQQILRLFGTEDETWFDRDQYFNLIRNRFRREPRDFEAQVREHLRVQKLLEKVRQEFPANPEVSLKQWLAELMARAKLEIYQPRS